MSRKLSTIQKRENLNDVFSTDEIGPGGAYHCYNIIPSNDNPVTTNVKTPSSIPKMNVTIQFQKGPRKDPNSIHGILDVDLLEIVRDRLKAFQAGPFSSRENACALTHIEEALMWLNRRVEDRIERNVLGKNEK